MEKNQMNRRSFLKGLGTLGIGALAASTPWLAAFSEVEQTKDERIRIGMIGPGSRGQFLLSFLAQNPKANIVALADVYQPSLDEAMKIVPKAKTY